MRASDCQCQGVSLLPHQCGHTSAGRVDLDYGRTAPACVRSADADTSRHILSADHTARRAQYIFIRWTTIKSDHEQRRRACRPTVFAHHNGVIIV